MGSILLFRPQAKPPSHSLPMCLQNSRHRGAGCLSRARKGPGEPCQGR